MPSIRIQRLQKELLKLFNTSIRFKIRDKRLSGVTITDVSVTSDMMYAKIYFSYISDEGFSPEEMVALLSKSSGFFKKEIAGAHLMRIIPELRFIHDNTEEYSQKIESIFEQIHKEENDES